MRDTTVQKYRQSFRAALVQGADFVGRYGFPMLAPVSVTPARAVPFDKALRGTDKRQWVHFYTDDYRFERLWNRPERYLALLRAYEGAITPDFSVYTFLPEAMQIWNTYRNRALAFWMQQNGIPILPNVRWGERESYAYCFDGIPKGSAVAVSTNGWLRSAADRVLFRRGLEEMAMRLRPAAIVNYGSLSKGIFDAVLAEGIPVYAIEHYQRTVRKGGEG